MTFADDNILEKLEDGSRQTRRLPRLEPKSEGGQIMQEVVSFESGRSLQQTRRVSRQSEDLSPSPMFELGQAVRSTKRGWRRPP